VIATTIFPSGPIELPRAPFWSPAIDTAIVDVNAFIRELDVEQCEVFDAYALLATNAKVAPAFEIDALHLNEAGYIALNRSIAPRLRELAHAAVRNRRALVNTNSVGFDPR
jgi:hypothetical protein